MQIDFPELTTVQQALECCRVDYLFGMDGKKPCRDTEKLAVKYGLKTMQITKHASSWLAELRAHAVAASVIYGSAADPETVEMHERDVAWIRVQIDKLEERMDKLTEAGGETYEFLLRQMLKLQVRWSKLAGIEDALKLSALVKLTYAREEVKNQVAAASELPPPRDGSEARQVSAKVFDIGE